MSLVHRKRPISTLILLALIAAGLGCRSDAPGDREHGHMYDLIERILPGRSSHFVIERLTRTDGQEAFELHGENGKVVLAGTNDLAIARAFDRYLTRFCHTRVSWYLDDPIVVPDVLPAVDEPVSQVCRFPNRFLLNYCTFGYTLLWWEWADWERFIDWMALNGVNMPLAITGQEAVWMQVWRDYGMSDEQIRSYFSGPSHLPWHRMGNLDGYLGPLPQAFIDGQFELQKRILERERAFGMTPVLPAFAGHVPRAIRDQFPDAKITSMGSYTLGEQYDAFFLDPMDPLFIEIQQKFLRAQTEAFGTDHLYGADPFNEMDPPDTSPEYLARVSKTIYDGMSSIDPDAVWVQMGWTFYYMKLWRDEPARLEAMIKAVPEDRMVILDYFAEREEVWRNTDAWHGAPYIWCYLGNFGGNTEMAAPILEISRRLPAAEDDPAHGKMTGVGSTLEGFNVNRFMFEWLFDYVWDRSAEDAHDWITRYARTRTGGPDPIAEAAYRDLVDLVFDDQISNIGTGSLMQARPALSGVKGYQRPNKYDYRKLADILGAMLTADARSLDNPGYRQDLVVVTKQVLDNLIIPLRKKIDAAFEARDAKALDAWTGTFLEVMDHQDRLLATRPEHLLGKWIHDARSFGDTPEAKDYYEKSARVLISTWGREGCTITDYASRDLSGLISTYYKERWVRFFDRLRECLRTGAELDMEAFDTEMAAFEWGWTDQHHDLVAEPQGDMLEVVREIHAQLGPLFEICND